MQIKILFYELIFKDIKLSFKLPHLFISLILFINILIINANVKSNLNTNNLLKNNQISYNEKDFFFDNFIEEFSKNKTNSHDKESVTNFLGNFKITKINTENSKQKRISFLNTNKINDKKFYILKNFVKNLFSNFKNLQYTKTENINLINDNFFNKNNINKTKNKLSLKYEINFLNNFK